MLPEMIKEQLEVYNNYLKSINRITENYKISKEKLSLILSKEYIDYIEKLGIDITDSISNIIDLLDIRLNSEETIPDEEIILMNIIDELDLIDANYLKDLYVYVSVIYDDDIVAKTIHEPSFYYKTDKLILNRGDKVLVDRKGSLVIGIVDYLEYTNKENAPYPFEQTKEIIELIQN